MQIRHQRVHEKGLEPIDSMYVHLVCDHGMHPHQVDMLDLEGLREEHRIDHESHDLDASLRRTADRMLRAWDSGDKVVIANALASLRAAVKGVPERQRRELRAVE